MSGPPQMSESIIFVTHVEADNVYLRIWGQVEKNYVGHIERAIHPLNTRFSRGQNYPIPEIRNLAVDTLCCARFQDDGFYRARIRSIHPDGRIIVHFIDYGNVEAVSNRDIYLIDDIPNAEILRTGPPAAIRFTLSNVMPVNGTWDIKIVKSIEHLLRYKEWKISIVWIMEDHRLIKLLYNNEDFAEFLIKRRMAEAAVLKDMFRYKVSNAHTYQQSGTKLTNNSSSLPAAHGVPLHSHRNIIRETWQNSPSPRRMPKPEVEEIPAPEALVFKSRVLDIGSTHNVYVSYVDEGPTKFSVQIQSTSHILAKLMRDINEHPTEPLKEPPLPGSVCLGRYTQENVLCRAVVMSVMQNKCKLYYVDFGHTEVLPYADIFQLPPQYIKPQVLSVRFSLSGVQDLSVTDEIKEYFKSLVTNKLLILHVRPPEGPPLIQYGDLYENGINVRDVLKQAFPTPTMTLPKMSIVIYQKPCQLKKGAGEFVNVSFVESCNKFFTQLEKGIQSLKSVMTCLTEYAKTASTLSFAQVTVGLPCAALYEQQWYRAQILDIIDDKIKVLYVDYGNQEIVPITSLRTIHEDLVTKLQAQAIQCSLNGHETLLSNKEVLCYFESVTLEQRLYMEVVDVHLDRLIVELYNPERTETIKSRLSRMLSPTEKSFKAENMNITKTPDVQSEIHSYSEIIRDKRMKMDNRPPPQNEISFERGKSKIRKDEVNEDKQRDTRFEKTNSYHSGTHHDRFNREVRNGKFGEENSFTQREQNETNPFRSDRDRNKTMSAGKRRDGFDNRPNRPIHFDNKHSPHNTHNQHNRSGSEKVWSDRDSDASSKSGSDKRSRNNSSPRGARGGRAIRGGGVSDRLQNNRWNDRNGDRSRYERPGRPVDDSRNFKFKDRKERNNSLTYKKTSDIENWENDADNTVPDFRKCSPPKMNISIGDVKQCELVFTNSPYDFFLQLKPESDKLNEIMDRIASIYENGGDILKNSKLSASTYCVARYSEDMKWYRALIKSVEENSTTVQFIDYGNVESVAFDEIKSIREEFLTLSAQAVHCKLLAVTNCDPAVFSQKVEGKFLEAEFVTERNDIYEILLREVIDDVPSSTYINEELQSGINLVQAKQSIVARNDNVNKKTTQQFDYVSPDARWMTNSYEFETKQNVIVTWFVNPNNFYCQPCEKETEFRAMMNDIQKIYVGRQRVKQNLQIGSPVIAVFAEDGALYRAEIMEVKLDGHMVQYVDFGNCAVVEESKIYPVEKKLMQLPKLAFNCTLKNIKPLDDKTGWSTVNVKAIDACFNHDNFECTLYNKEDDKYVVSLKFEGQDIADTLVEQKLAARIEEEVVHEESITEVREVPFQAEELEPIDITLLPNQTLRVRISCVESVFKFYAQLPPAAKVQDAINTYMSGKDTKVMPHLSKNNVCIGAGCLVCTDGIWRRAVVINSSCSKGFQVKFIDTGANYKISNYAIALPSELSVVQKQTIECYLKCNEENPEINNKLKELIEGKEVLIHVEEIDNNRLVVKLFDLTGKRINIDDNIIEESICPICPMPILNSRHKVSVSFANHSGSIWLQRLSDYDLDAKLHEELETHCLTSKKLVDYAPDMLCAAKSSDGHWYRAKILKCTPNGAYVLFIDFGNTEEVSRDLLMELESQFLLPHQLAVNVSLTVTLNTNEAEQVDILLAHLSKKQLTAVFYNINKKWFVELLDNDEKISDKFNELNTEIAKGTYRDNNSSNSAKYEVYVHEVVSPSDFWIQRVDHLAEIDKMQGELQTIAKNCEPFLGHPEDGTLCLAVYSANEEWYRAEVLDADSDISTVRFIDYGNTDVIYNTSEKIRNLPDSLKTISRYATRCRLDIIPVDSEDWSDAISDRFRSLISSAEQLYALDSSSNSTPKRIELFANGKSIGGTLVEENMAVKICTEEEPIDEIVDLELDPHSAFVSHIISPDEFWVQEEKSIADLETLSDRFIMADLFDKIEKIEEGLLCVAKFPDDGMWYRARVISHDDEAGTQVLFVDYGNSSLSNEIRKIPEDVAELSPLSRKSRLCPPEGIKEWSKEACEKFVELAADGATIFLLDVLEESETSLVKLSLEGQNVSDILAEHCGRCSPLIEERLPPLGEENAPNVTVSHVESPAEFWVQEESSVSELEMMSERLQNASSFLPLNDSGIGTICAAKYPEDEQWYRAKILSFDGTSAEVFYIDYGSSAKTSELRMLPEDIVNIPVLSKRFALRLPENVTSWSQEACEAFKQLAADGATLFQFEALDDKDPMLVRLSVNNVDVMDTLLPYLIRQEEETSVPSDIQEKSEINELITDMQEEKETSTEQNVSDLPKEFPKEKNEENLEIQRICEIEKEGESSTAEIGRSPDNMIEELPKESTSTDVAEITCVDSTETSNFQCSEASPKEDVDEKITVNQTKNEEHNEATNTLNVEVIDITETIDQPINDTNFNNKDSKTNLTGDFPTEIITESVSENTEENLKEVVDSRVPGELENFSKETSRQDVINSIELTVEEIIQNMEKTTSADTEIGETDFDADACVEETASIDDQATKEVPSDAIDTSDKSISSTNINEGKEFDLETVNNVNIDKCDKEENIEKIDGTNVKKEEINIEKEEINIEKKDNEKEEAVASNICIPLQTETEVKVETEESLNIEKKEEALDLSRVTRPQTPVSLDVSEKIATTELIETEKVSKEETVSELKIEDILDSTNNSDKNNINMEDKLEPTE